MKSSLLPTAFVLLAAAAVAAEGPTATAAVCTAVKDRVPEGTAETFPASVGELFCFSRLANVTDKVVHVWFRGEKEVLRIELPVRAPRWRTWSAKKVVPDMTGAWRVEVQDAAGVVLATARFTVE